jgi:hypothetical protein
LLNVYKQFLNNKFQQMITEELNGRSKKEILHNCSKELLKTINLNPYKYPQQINIVAFCSDNEDRVFASYVNHQGQFKDSLLLPHFIKCSLAKDP